MSQTNIRILAGILVGALIFALQWKGADADDVPTCQDLPTHQAVLEAGKRALNQTGDYRHNWPDTWNLIDSKPNWVRTFPVLQDPPPETLVEIQKLRIDSPANVQSALEKAEQLELYRKLEVAEVLYRRLLAEVAPENTDLWERTKVFEGILRSGFRIQLPASSWRELQFLSSKDVSEYERKANQDNAHRFAIVEAIKKANTSLSLDEADKFCDQALKFRTSRPFNQELAAVDMFIRGGIEERRGKTELALCYYIPAMELDHDLVRLPIQKMANPADAPKELQLILTAISNEGESPEQALVDLRDLREAAARVPSDSPGMDKIKGDLDQLVAYQRKIIKARPCLEMADKLDSTAFALERNNQYDMAWKLYNQSLDIKRINLGPSDIDTTKQMIDLARVAGDQKKYLVSKDLFQKAIKELKVNPQADSSDITNALETYAQMLGKWGHFAEARKVYNEARQLALKAKHPVQ